MPDQRERISPTYTMQQDETMKHVLSDNPHSPGVTHSAWDDGYATGRRDVVEQYGGHAVASQAAAMARLLLKLEWSAEPDDGGSCPVCGGWAPGVAGINAGHRADCEFAAVLRAAGVLP